MCHQPIVSPVQPVTSLMRHRLVCHQSNVSPVHCVTVHCVTSQCVNCPMCNQPHNHAISPVYRQPEVSPLRCVNSLMCHRSDVSPVHCVSCITCHLPMCHLSNVSPARCVTCPCVINRMHHPVRVQITDVSPVQCVTCPISHLSNLTPPVCPQSIASSGL